MTPITATCQEILRLDKEGTGQPWNYEHERYSARCVIGLKPFDDRWLAHCQPELNGDANARLIAYYRNTAPAIAARLMVVEEKLKRAIEEVQKYANDNQMESFLLDLEKLNER